jgi:hypothetical protein
MRDGAEVFLVLEDGGLGLNRGSCEGGEKNRGDEDSFHTFSVLVMPGRVALIVY